MKRNLIFSVFAAAVFTAHAGIILSEKGKTEYSIQLPENAHQTVSAAAQDLKDYMKKSAGIDLKISADAKGKKIILKKNPALQREEYEVRINGNDLILSGGDHYGIANAVYAFLENQMGIRWFTWYGDEKVPKYQDVKLDFPAYRKKPHFPIRWSIIQTVPKAAKAGNFFRRNASGRMIPDEMKPFIGSCHTLFWYLPPKKAFMNNPENWKWKKEHYYFKTNPEFYSLSGSGKRVDSLQLCLSNAEMRKEFKKRFSERVELKGKVGTYSLSAMDWPGRFCYCKNCIALEKKYKCEGGAFYDFLIDMANFAKEKYPNIYISTLAYRKEQSERPPAVEKLPDNLVIIFAPIDDNFSKDLDHPDNAGKVLAQWRKITKHLWIWYYASTYGSGGANLYTGIGRNIRDLKIMKRIGLDGMYWEIDVGTRSGLAFNDLRLWLMLKMWNDPELDEKKLIREFCEFHYGKAADDMIQYIAEFDTNLDKYSGNLLWHAADAGASDEQLIRWTERFNAMEKTVSADPRHLENIKHARIVLDLSVLRSYKKLAAAKKGLFPAPKVIHDTLLQNMKNTLKRRMPTDKYLQNYDFPSLKNSAAAALVSATIEPKKLPAQFDQYPEEKIRRVIPHVGPAWEMKEFSDAGFGRAITAKKNKKTEVPFTCGVYEASGRKFLLNRSIKKDEIVIDKFHYYKIGETTAPGITACIFWTSRSWNANVSLGSFARAGLDTNDQKYEVWAEMKFEGKGHSPQSKSNADNVWIGEVVIIRK